MRPSFPSALVLCLLALGAHGATFTAQDTRLTVNTATLQVSFTGADVVGITNQLTGESYLRDPSASALLNLTLQQ